MTLVDRRECHEGSYSQPREGNAAPVMIARMPTAGGSNRALTSDSLRGME
ncbi:hypothetical protein Pan216_55870 [Planctomycetes bacterium Pan216]|uniref:Uncharacterized protein n=1 Tax=Kolteria novifilia TaxID=2527975 RepID=A0A518BCI5_9BACT|nr:hypothetical protein Pan216_55870 [Planctomycetes bacterium Pan216]